MQTLHATSHKCSRLDHLFGHAIVSTSPPLFGYKYQYPSSMETRASTQLHLPNSLIASMDPTGRADTPQHTPPSPEENVPGKRTMSNTHHDVSHIDPSSSPKRPRPSVYSDPLAAAEIAAGKRPMVESPIDDGAPFPDSSDDMGRLLEELEAEESSEDDDVQVLPQPNTIPSVQVCCCYCHYLDVLFPFHPALKMLSALLFARCRLGHHPSTELIPVLSTV